MSWDKTSWRGYPALQQPVWPDPDKARSIQDKLAALPALVFAGESRQLQQELAEAAKGRAFVLQAGDCAEEFSRCHGPTIHDLLKVILQMSVVLTYAGEKKVVKIARAAGQYAKPRTSDYEVISGEKLPVYRGDMVNGADPNGESRIADPSRMLQGYNMATATLNLIRAFTTGGYAGLEHVHAWTEACENNFRSNPKYESMVFGIQKAIRFMASIGVGKHSPLVDQVSLYTSHEALLLEYEEAMTRVDTTTGDWYDASAHMLWVGNRTRAVDGAHVEFLRGVKNPLGIKVGLDYTIDDIQRLLDKLNPDNTPGRISIITRFGSTQVGDALPPLVVGMQEAGRCITWLCDPMHGNTKVDASGVKYRVYDDLISEFSQFWRVHDELGSIAGGIHLELTGEAVTECTGGGGALSLDDLRRNYCTTCDPRLNAEQAVELTFEVAHFLQNCSK